MPVKEIDRGRCADNPFTGDMSIAVRASVANLLVPIFFSLGGLLLYYLLYRSRLLPRFISVWGFVAAVLILLNNLLLTFNAQLSIGISLIFVLPIIVNEVLMGIWLIVGDSIQPQPFLNLRNGKLELQ